MTTSRLLDLVDTRDFRTLFIDELGWDNPDQPILQLTVDDELFTLTQVAGYKGLRIWHCSVLPPRRIQRGIDILVGKDNHERLIIFTSENRQEWRWPRRAQLGSINAKLLVHEHVVGDRKTHLMQRLQAIELDFDENLSLVALLERMRDAFDVEAETASVQAARLMGTLYTELERSGTAEEDATLLLARLLFLLFGDDADMNDWPADLFERFIRDHTTAATLHNDLAALFRVLNTRETERTLQAASSPYGPFRYINGGLYEDSLAVRPLTPAFREALIAACEFDWAIISPAVFGSMFQTVKSKVARRPGGEHYTTEVNILKTIRPLFLDEYTGRIQIAWDDKAQLTKIHNELGRLRFLDPACGCGNFLIVAYRELRALELDILKRRRDLDNSSPAKTNGGIDRSQLSLDVTGDIKVTLDHFYGIEIEEWPARIAETAMLLVDHLANQRMAQEFGQAPDRLPIAIAPTIHHGNALMTDWRHILPPTEDVIIMGNPPFGGDRQITTQQKAELRTAWGGRFTAHLDYVTGWYAKAISYYGERRGRWAFVSTNSICQGEPVSDLWQPLLQAGWRCRFAHRSFRWGSESPGQAAVHVSIIGFDRSNSRQAPLWTYPEGGVGEPERVEAFNINPYLGVGPNVLVHKRNSGPLGPDLPQVAFGSMARDGGNLLVEVEDYDEIAADPVARKYLRRFVGASELINGTDRWCLWMTDLNPNDVEQSSILRSRIEATRLFRLKSKAASTQGMAATAHLFAQRTHPRTDYVSIPRHVSEHRKYFTVMKFSKDVVTGDANFLAEDPDGFILGVLSSSMFIAWMRAIGGRLESRLRFSKNFTYNSFPLPRVTERQKEAVVNAANEIVRARAAQKGASLAKLYSRSTAMPSDLARAHEVLDQTIDRIFGKSDFDTEIARQNALFRHYAALAGQENLL